MHLTKEETQIPKGSHFFGPACILGSPLAPGCHTNVTRSRLQTVLCRSGLELIQLESSASLINRLRPGVRQAASAR